ncbi:MAG: hypothetical protein UX04_C0004G0025 [Microgenomates group bacterium GW2011_GWF2_45_18]|nr:MAG: hypothetical protein UW18_C0004G0025 [Microgenomates group bacterium GW2011_GWF1_44_10]KKU01681.1 MAG: hypothetical protein UX04_C0004G0025 [Microgenomates group bacterium GW2011_GWF2_45_18]HAU98601.1 hypothetical protein [Candidatus Paceibacterota bacterium]
MKHWISWSPAVHVTQSTRLMVCFPVRGSDLEILRAWYVHETHREFSVYSPHITLIPPFFCDLAHANNVADVISNSQPFPVPISLTDSGVFHQNGKSILFLHAEPAEEIAKFAENLELKFADMITIDLTPYTNQQRPPFEAHLTVEYDWKDSVASTNANIKIQTKTAELWIETG